MLGALLLLAIWLGNWWRLHASEARNRDLAAQVADRTLEIAEQTADLEALSQADAQLDRHEQLNDLLQELVDIAVNILRADKSAVLSWDNRSKKSSSVRHATSTRKR